jgi:hypothetical protein
MALALALSGEQLAGAFSYKGLATGITGDLKRAATRIRELVGEQHKSVIETGRIFLDIKVKLDHGRFLAWAEAECAMSARSVQRYMSVAEMATKYDTVSYFEPTALYLLAAPSTPGKVRQGIFDRAAKGETIRSSEIKTSIREAREKDPRPKTSIGVTPVAAAPETAPKAALVEVPEATKPIPAAETPVAGAPPAATSVTSDKKTRRPKHNVNALCEARDAMLVQTSFLLHEAPKDTYDALNRLVARKHRVIAEVSYEWRVDLVRRYAAALGVTPADLTGAGQLPAEAVSAALSAA